MLDNFHEEVVQKRNRAASTLLYGLAWVGVVLFGLVALMGISSLMNGQFSVPSIVIMVISGGVAFLIWRYKDELRAEYDYTFTNGEFEAARVLGNARRRYLTSLSVKTVEAAGLVSHNSFQRYLSMKDVKKHNWFLNRDAELLFMFFSKKGVKHLIIVEPSDEMVVMIKKYLPFSVWQA